MTAGLVNCYKVANQPQPKVIYVDRDCCAMHRPPKVVGVFQDWENLLVRLDIWHFGIWRFAAAFTTESHQLYGVFLLRLSHCIFVWDNDDAQSLSASKRGELRKEGLRNLSDPEVHKR